MERFILNNQIKKYVENGMYGLKTIDGRILIKAQYEDMGDDFYEGRLRVKSKGLWGYIDENGLEICKPQFAGACNYKNGYAQVMKEFVTVQTINVEERIKELEELPKQFHVLQTLRYFKELKKKGVNVYTHQFKYSKAGLLDINGKLVIDTVYDTTSCTPINGMLKTCESGKYGFYSTEAKKITSGPIFELVGSPLGDDAISVMYNSSLRCVDVDGTIYHSYKKYEFFKQLLADANEAKQVAESKLKMAQDAIKELVDANGNIIDKAVEKAVETEFDVEYALKVFFTKEKVRTMAEEISKKCLGREYFESEYPLRNFFENPSLSSFKKGFGNDATMLKEVTAIFEDFISTSFLEDFIKDFLVQDFKEVLTKYFDKLFKEALTEISESKENEILLKARKSKNRKETLENLWCEKISIGDFISKALENVLYTCVLQIKADANKESSVPKEKAKARAIKEIAGVKTGNAIIKALKENSSLIVTAAKFQKLYTTARTEAYSAKEDAKNLHPQYEEKKRRAAADMSFI